MTFWLWVILAFIGGIAVAAVVWPRLARIIRSTPPADLPEQLAPGWHACCTRCGRTRTLASVGGIRLGGNRSAVKATLGWCRGCKGLRLVRIVHQDRLEANP
ncbi:MAG: hypothetical protein NCW75_10085 [Phycisphaera sp.]|nr:MAG: hypothetical protein NCW75_10085 [Phycisphaera sp.]